MALRDDMSVAPMLAQSIRVSDDGLSYTFRLRDGARFHNGAPVTADDVVYAWRNFYLNPDNDWECLPYYDGTGTIMDRTNGAHVVAIEATTPATVTFRLAAPSALFLARMADVACPPLIFHRDSMKGDAPWSHFIGTGPYEFVRWDKGKEVVLRRFRDYVPRSEPRDGYAGAKIAYADEIRFEIIPQREAQIDALKQGNIDVVMDLGAEERTRLENVEGIQLRSTSTINFWNLLIQTSDPLLSDVRVRRAIAQAIDIDYIAAVLTDGRQSGNPSVISTNSEFYSAAQREGHPFDPSAARKLLREAGYDGRKIEILANRDEFPEMYRIAVIVRSMLRAVGMNAVLTVLPWKEQLDDRYRNGTFQLQSFGQGGRDHPLLVYGKFIGPKGEKARFQWDSDDAFQQLRVAQALTDRTALQHVFDDLHRQMLEEVPTLALFNFEYHDATRDDIRGFHTTPFMRTTFWGVWKGRP
ncbi:MAG: ABC transporter substrate-binding protein [Woeseiaceae bacterium]